MLAINYLCLHRDHQPDFDRLLTRGWVHPLGLHDEPLERSLVKDWDGLQFQVVQTGFSRAIDGASTYTEIFVHPQENTKHATIRKGFGNFYLAEVACAALAFLEAELGG